MNKKTILIIAAIVLIIAAIIAIIYVNSKKPVNNTTSDAIKFKEEYEALNGKKKSDGVTEHMTVNIPNDNPIKYINDQEVLNILNNGTGIIYFGMPECPWCRNMITVLFDVAKEKQVNTIYYFNPKQIRQDNTENYKKIVEKLKEYLPVDTATQSEEDPNFDASKKRLYVPDVYFVKDGKVLGNNFKTVDSQKDPKIALTTEQKAELNKIYKNYMNKILNCEDGSTNC